MVGCFSLIEGTYLFRCEKMLEVSVYKFEEVHVFVRL